MNINRNQLNLIDRLQNPHDHQAWQEFDKTYRLLIYNSAIYYGLNSHDAEDLTQIILVKLWNKIPKSRYDREKGEFQSWLKRVIYNTAMSYHRNKNTETKKLENITLSTPKAELDVKADQEWKTYSMSIVMNKLKEHFSGKALKVFQMCLDGRETNEISSIMSIEENTVYQLKRRVKNKIIDELKLLGNQ